MDDLVPEMFNDLLFQCKTGHGSSRGGLEVARWLSFNT